MFREIILPIFRSTRLCVTACGIMHTRCCRPATGRQHRGCITPQAVTQSSAPVARQNYRPKHVELTGIINKPLLLHLVGCLYNSYQRCMVKQISDNEIYLLIKYIKSVLSRVARCLSFLEVARCLKVKGRFTHSMPFPCLVAPLPCSDSAVSFVNVRIVAGNIRTASPTV